MGDASYFLPPGCEDPTLADYAAVFVDKLSPLELERFRRKVLKRVKVCVSVCVYVRVEFVPK